MFITIPVLIGRCFGEYEAGRANVAVGRERTPEEVESELEMLLAPHSYSTTLNISSGGPGEEVRRTVPNYGARFDFWDVDDNFSDRLRDELTGLKVEQMIYARKEAGGHEVIAASDLPRNVRYEAMVTPDGRYHDLWHHQMPAGEAVARAERIICEHSECLAVVCKARA